MTSGRFRCLPSDQTSWRRSSSDAVRKCRSETVQQVQEQDVKVSAVASGTMRAIQSRGLNVSYVCDVRCSFELVMNLLIG